MEKIKSIYIYGKSGHGSVVADIALMNGYKKIVYIDDDKNKKDAISYQKNLDKNIPIALGIGDNKIRKKIALKIKNDGFKLATLIHPSCIISPSVKIAKGVVIMPHCVINANVQIGKGAILNTNCVIEHDCKIFDFVHVSPSASLAGGVKVGNLTHIGINACVKECIKIGKNCIIGAGSVVIKNIAKDMIYAGVPAKKIRKNNE